MAKKSDILLNYYNEFPAFLKEHKIRSSELERVFLHAKNDYQSYLDRINEKFSEEEEKLTAKYYQIELIHHEKIKHYHHNFKSELSSLQSEIENHHTKTTNLYNEEDELYQNILNQFEDRKAEAFGTYLQLTKENNYRIDREMKVHHEFIEEEGKKLNAKKIQYQDLNSTLSNKLLWTMEKAKNALYKLSSTLNEEGKNNKEYLDETINNSLIHLKSSREVMVTMFKTSTLQFENEKRLVSTISKDKRKPHSEINQRMISSFVKQIREVNRNRKNFEVMIRNELELSLSRLYPKIIEADASGDTQTLEKFILQKEIIEKKVDFLLKRNQTLSDLLISKYQNEIKKVKIDSFKRFEEIKIAYSVPVAFFQNSIDVYSNFAFYLNETYDDLSQMLTKFKQYNEDYIKYKTDYIHDSQKTFEDYKLNLLVKVNDITNHLTEYISRIDELSNQIVTLESNNRLEIAEIRKKMENLDVFGDYQKYIASLENDQFFAMHQHSKNIEKIQIESNYTNNLLDINKEVLLLNHNKLDYQEYQDYMLMLSNHEKDIQDLGHKRKIEETKAKYMQKIDQIVALREIARHKIIYNAKKTNYGYASTYIEHLNSENRNKQIGAEKVIDFVHHVQNLIDINTKQEKDITEYIRTTTDNYAYLRALEKNRLYLIEQVERTTKRKNHICEKACTIYETEISNLSAEFHHAFTKYIALIKERLLKLQSIDTNWMDTIHHNGYRNELTSLIHFIYKKTLSMAYKYQLPKCITDLDNHFEEVIGAFIFKNVTCFNRIDKKKKLKTRKKLLKAYFIETYTLLEKYQAYIDLKLTNILDIITKNDKSFILNTKLKAQRNIAIINKEYEHLQFYALKNIKSQKRQLGHFHFHSSKINNLYKKQVENINKEYLNQVSESDKVNESIYRKLVKIVKKNNRELKQMIQFMEKMFNKEQKQLDKQFIELNKSLEIIHQERQTSHSQEVSYIKSLYQKRDLQATKTIAVLESKINDLPIEKSNQYLRIKKEKYQLQTVKGKELQKRLSEIEKEKFVSRPKYMAEMDRIKNQLPEDYMSLYRNIQSLEFDFLNQFSTINDAYSSIYTDYLQKQTGTSKVLESDSALYQAFEDFNDFSKKTITTTASVYKDTYNKSNKYRNRIKDNRQKSEVRQKRIIND